MKKELLGNVGVGKVFVFNGGLFVVEPFNYTSCVYANLCITTRNPQYEVGKVYDVFDENIEVEVVEIDNLKSLIPKNKEYEDL